MSEHEAEKGMVSRDTAAECDCERLRHHVREQQMLIQLLYLKKIIEKERRDCLSEIHQLTEHTQMGAIMRG